MRLDERGTQAGALKSQSGEESVGMERVGMMLVLKGRWP